jgi:hypothetical protein
MDTPKAQKGTWTLPAPDGREWKAESPLRVVGVEMRERVPTEVALERIKELVEPNALFPPCPICHDRFAPCRCDLIEDIKRYEQALIEIREWIGTCTIIEDVRPIRRALVRSVGALNVA